MRGISKYSKRPNSHRFMSPLFRDFKRALKKKRLSFIVSLIKRTLSVTQPGHRSALQVSISQLLWTANADCAAGSCGRLATAPHSSHKPGWQNQKDLFHFVAALAVSNLTKDFEHPWLLLLRWFTVQNCIQFYSAAAHQCKHFYYILEFNKYGFTSEN